MMKSSRQQAIQRGQTTYFTGEPCVHGHVAKRYASSGACIECVKRAAAVWAQDNPDRKRASREESRARTDPPEKARQRAKENYYRKGREYWAKTKHQWRKSNPEKQAALKAAQRARRAAADGSHTGEDIARLMDQQGSKCAICHEPIGHSMKPRDFHVDHIVPLSKGGSNWPTNIQLLCPPCNQDKRDHVPYGH